jgi:hypothetical protein
VHETSNDKRKRDPRVDQQRSDGVHETTNDTKRRHRDRRVLQQPTN